MRRAYGQFAKLALYFSQLPQSKIIEGLGLRIVHEGHGDLTSVQDGVSRMIQNVQRRCDIYGTECLAQEYLLDPFIRYNTPEVEPLLTRLCNSLGTPVDCSPGFQPLLDVLNLILAISRVQIPLRDTAPGPGQATDKRISYCLTFSEFLRYMQHPLRPVPPTRSRTSEPAQVAWVTEAAASDRGPRWGSNRAVPAASRAFAGEGVDDDDGDRRPCSFCGSRHHSVRECDHGGTA